MRVNELFYEHKSFGFERGDLIPISKIAWPVTSEATRAKAAVAVSTTD
jgi:hypothetical protein